MSCPFLIRMNGVRVCKLPDRAKVAFLWCETSEFTKCKDYIRVMGERRTMIRCKECGKLFEDLPTMANHFIDDHFDVVFDIIAGEFAEEVDVYVKNGRIVEVKDNETVSRSKETQTLTKIFENGN